MKRVLLGGAAAIAMVVAIVSCDDDSRYVYTARRFDEANGCVDPYTAIERVEGDEVSVLCPEACLTVKDVVFVSTVCPPLPSIAQELGEDDPRCQAALEAFRSEEYCDPSERGDGGVEEDGGEEDGGGEDEDASDDAAEDAEEEI